MQFLDPILDRYHNQIILFLSIWCVIATWAAFNSHSSNLSDDSVMITKTELSQFTERLVDLEAANLRQEKQVQSLVNKVSDYEVKLAEHKNTIDVQRVKIDHLQAELNSRDQLIEQLISQRDKLERQVEDLNRKLNLIAFQD